MTAERDAAAHTPGPWTANLHHTRQDGGRTYGFIFADGVVPTAAVVLGVEGMPQDEGRANARLIAAAPDMLAALKLVDAFAKADEAAGDDALWTDHFREMFEVVRAAIAKAEGRL